MSKPGHNSKVQAGPVNAERLKSFVERIERLEEERKAIGGDVKDVYSEAKGVGYDVKTMRQIVKERSQDPADRDEQETLLEVYRHALGMGTYRSVAAQYGISKSKLHRLVPREENGTSDPETGEITNIPAPRGGSLPWAPEAPGASPPVVTLDLDGGERSSIYPDDDMPDPPPFLRRGAA
jgi:uncharacterized protein (UPF0335 family)